MARNNQSTTDIIPSFARGIKQIKGINYEIDELVVRKVNIYELVVSSSSQIVEYANIKFAYIVDIYHFR